ncbi:MAG: amino acid permease [Labilithrix sp.]|nr:amino acid permease [Labilithrix sp.]
MSIFARKPIAELLAHTEGEGGLARALGPASLTALGIGAIIGSGIFVMTGRVAADDAGPAVIVSFLVAGLACALAALCYAELASMVPVAGSAYTYAQAALGEIFAWMIGWDLVLEYAMSGACIASSWSHYFDELLRVAFGVRLPEIIASDPFSSQGRSIVNLPAVLVMGAVTWLLVVGIKQSARANAAMVAIKIAIVIFVIALGASFVSSSNLFGVPIEARKPVVDAASKWGLFASLGIDRSLVSVDDAIRSPFAPYGLSGIMLGSSIVFFAYLGFDCVSTHAEEAIRPKRDVPLAILASLVICTTLYVGVATVLTGMDPYPTIDTHAAAASAFRRRAEAGGGVFLRASAALIALGALAGMTSVLLVTFLGQARIFLAMARDGLLPRSLFASVHPRFRTPHRSTILTGAVTAVVAGFTPITKLEEMVNIGTLTAFSVVCVAVLVLRVRRPDEARAFRCPALFVVAPAGVLVNVVMMLFLPLDTWLRLFVWLALGLAIYFTYGRRSARLARRSGGGA